MRHRRPDWDEYFMEIAHVVARRSTCIRRQIGAVIVRDKRILTTGYNGAPMGLAHCLEDECLRDKMGIASGTRQEMCRALHAEQNAVIQAALHGIPIQGGTLYCTNQPCVLCAKTIINAGIVRIVYERDYPDQFALDLIQEAEIELVKFDRAAEKVREEI
jgi:dCMP deaminase